VPLPADSIETFSDPSSTLAAVSGLGRKSTLMNLTSKATINLTKKLIVDVVSFRVTLTITFVVGLASRSADFASQFRLAPAPLETLLDTPPRPLIPPSQPRREGSAAGMGKGNQKNGAGARHIFSKFGYDWVMVTQMNR